MASGLKSRRRGRAATEPPDEDLAYSEERAGRDEEDADRVEPGSVFDGDLLGQDLSRNLIQRMYFLFQVETGVFACSIPEQVIIISCILSCLWFSLYYTCRAVLWVARLLLSVPFVEEQWLRVLQSGKELGSSVGVSFRSMW